MIQDVASVATAVGVLLAAVSLQQARRQRKRDFEDFYVRRYWKLMDRLSLDAMKGSLSGDAQERRKDERAIRAYFLLCEDELDLRHDRWIGTRTWNLWREGIESQMSRPLYEEVWQQVQKEREAGTEEGFRRLAGFLQSPTVDVQKPLREVWLSPRWRRLRA